MQIKMHQYNVQKYREIVPNSKVMKRITFKNANGLNRSAQLKVSKLILHFLSRYNLSQLCQLTEIFNSQMWPLSNSSLSKFLSSMQKLEMRCSFPKNQTKEKVRKITLLM